LAKDNWAVGSQKHPSASAARGGAHNADAVESDVFVYSGGEDLVPGFVQDGARDWTPGIVGSGSLHVRRYRPRIDSRFARIEKIAINGEAAFYWKVTTPDKLVTIFGRPAAARIADPNDPARIFRWHPEWTYDDRGNCAEFASKNEDLTNVRASAEETVDVLNVSYDPVEFAITGNAVAGGNFAFTGVLGAKLTLRVSQKSTLSAAAGTFKLRVYGGGGIEGDVGVTSGVSSAWGGVSAGGNPFERKGKD
jgi:hypothetical protein